MIIDMQSSGIVDMFSGPDVFDQAGPPPDDTDPITPGVGGPLREIHYLTGSTTATSPIEGRINDPP